MLLSQRMTENVYKLWVLILITVHCFLIYIMWKQLQYMVLQLFYLRFFKRQKTLMCISGKRQKKKKFYYNICIFIDLLFLGVDKNNRGSGPAWNGWNN